MSNRQDRGLDRIWPRVEAEIAAARRRRAAKRILLHGVTPVLLLVFAFAGAILGARWREEKRRTASARPVWTIDGINPGRGVADEYPLVCGRRIIAVRGRATRQRAACIDANTGALLWRSTLRFSSARLAADAERVYVLARSAQRGWVWTGLDAETGRTLWEQELPAYDARRPSTLTVTADCVCWSWRDRVVLRDAATGVLRWERSLAPRFSLSAPVFLDGALFVAAPDALCALGIRDGRTLWRHAADSGTRRVHGVAPLLEQGDGRLFCAWRDGFRGGTLLCVRTADRSALWERTIENPIRIQPMGRQVFVRSRHLTALDARTGAPIWAAEVGGCGDLSADDDFVYAVDAESRSRLLVLDRASGRPLWNHAVAASCNGVIVIGGMAYLSGNDGQLRSFALADHGGDTS